MIKEKELFIQILADHVNGRKTIVNDSDIRWYIILQYARKHQVSGIVYTQIKDYLPSGDAAQLKQRMLNVLYIHANRANDLEAVKTALKKEKIDCFIVKGPAVAELYPVPMLRTMGDIDMVVHSADRNRCHDILLQHGFSCITKQEDREWQYYKNKMEYELHDHLVYEETVNKKGQADFFNDYWKYITDGELDWNFHLLFLLFHLGKHLMNAGVGFRMFLDLAVVVEKKQIDWKWMEEKLKKTQMWTFARRCFGMVSRWFGITAPIADMIDDSFFESATEKIFDDGIFGHFDKNIKITNEVRHNVFPHLKMIHLLVRKVFPSVKELRREEQYAYLKKTGVLLPVAWVHKWITARRKIKGSPLTQGVKASFVSDEKRKERSKVLDQWGL